MVLDCSAQIAMSSVVELDLSLRGIGWGCPGKVIGVTFANLADDPTSNFAAEIKGAIEQLRIAGWTAPDH